MVLGVLIGRGGPALAGFVAVAMLANPGVAQVAGATQTAQADQLKRFEIPAQPLHQALLRFSREAGIELFFDSALTRNATSAALSGTFPTREALARLLAGTGFTFRFTNPTTVTLERLPQQTGAVTLDTVTVEGQQARLPAPHAPFAGFVAPSSAAGTKTDTPILETPQSISVVGSAEIATRNARTLADALGYTAGVRAGTMGASNGYGGDSTSIRGFGGNGTAGPSSNEYLDGMRLGGTGYLSSALDPYLFERIEVIKGPASVLYGQSTPGGLVNMVSKRPTASPLREVELQTGNRGRVQGSFDVSDRIDPAGRVLYRVTGVAYRHDAETDIADGKRRFAIAPSLTFRPNDRTSLTLMARYQNDDFGGSPLNWLPAYGTVLPNANGKLGRDLYTGDPNFERWKRESANIGYALEHRFDDTFTFRQNFRYLHNKLDHAGLYVSTLQADQRTANRQAFGMIEHSDDFTLDNQVEARFSTGPLQHTLLFGIDGQWFLDDTDRVLQSPAATLDLFNPVYGVAINATPYQKSESEGRQYGLYLQDQVAFDRLRLVLGLRQDWAKSESTNKLNGTSSSQKDDALTMRGAAMYLFDNGLAPYVSYTESFEPTVGTVLADGSLAKPTEGRQYEVGLKYQPTGFDSFMTASLFDLRRKNVVTRDPNNPTLSIQTGEITARGVELEAKASLAAGFNATVAYTYLDAEVTDSNNTTTGIDGVVVPIRGKTPTRVPEHAASLWLDYTFAEGPLRGFALGGGGRYVGRTMGDDANSFKVPAFTVFDAMLRYDLEGLDSRLAGMQVQLNAMNLFDKEYVSTCFGANRCYFGTGRTVYASLKYRW
ncbi:iron complex outermembrane receptor protein [Stella humosa]|uniref:Iron complex outermembrane receptor protein n=1 Tax=Stella humosa TaxID=94 RepID=A0A3N1MFI6_9PROT|nr:TonB-dependent siderophore receptor [Stella humosa]ROQ01487.1 iron complex outermembrane receptor protein [Stella humosa]BBK31865.1 ligand-gated channel [Stella humosa]